MMLKFENSEDESVGCYKTDQQGIADISFKGTGSGSLIILVRDQKYAKAKQPLDITDCITENWFAVRVLPHDAKLLKTTKEERLNWEFIYSNILRYYYLVFPGMSEKSLVALNSEAGVKEKASVLIKATSKDAIDKTWYMPASR